MNHALGSLRELHLGKVLSTQDPESRGRVEVEVASTGLILWASCVTNGAGSGYGVSLLPRSGETVILAFLGPDEGNAFVLGAVWSGGNSYPQDAGDVDDIYAITTPSGSKIIADDASGPKINIETQSGARVTITDDGGGTITIERGQESIRLSPTKINISASVAVEVDATSVNISATTIQADASISMFSGVVQCNTLVATSGVVSPSYTPGAGNIW